MCSESHNDSSHALDGCLLLYALETKARRGDGEYGRLYEGAEGRNSRGTHGHSLRVLKKAARRFPDDVFILLS